MSAPPVWVELHVDDRVLEGDASAWPAARDLVMRLAETALGRGARLSFRFRYPFARAAGGTGFLEQLARRGHEVGAHAHARRLPDTVRLLRDAGVNVSVAAPGLVQAGPQGREPLLRQAAGLGISVVTDHGPAPAWAYEGLEGRLEAGIWVMAPTVRPTDWGLLGRDGEWHGVERASFRRLRELEALAARERAKWFGVTVHEHDFCAPGSLSPSATALARFAEYLDARVQPSLAAARPVAQPGPVGRRRVRDAEVRVVRAVNTAFDAAARLRLARDRVDAGARPGDGPFFVDVADRRVAVERHGPEDAEVACLVCHAGRVGGRAQGLSPWGVSVPALVSRGWSVWFFDRSGTGDSPAGSRLRRDGWLAPGNAAHTAEWKALLARVRAQERAPVVALTWSSGILPVLRAARQGNLPDALVDAEAPADRWSLVPPRARDRRGPGPWDADPWQDEPWVDLEPARLLAHLPVPYLRLQGAIDHVHGEMTLHARRMVEAAGPWAHPLEILPGSLHGNPDALARAVEWARAELIRRRSS